MLKANAGFLCIMSFIGMKRWPTPVFILIVLTPWRVWCHDILISLGGGDEWASCAWNLQLFRDFNLTLFTCVPLERESAEDGANFLGKIVRMMSALITSGRKVLLLFFYLFFFARTNRSDSSILEFYFCLEHSPLWPVRHPCFDVCSIWKGRIAI